MKEHHVILELNGEDACSVSKRLLNDLIDAELDAHSALSVTKHLEVCAECAEYYNQLKFIVDTVITLDEIPIPDDVSERLNDFLRENIKRKL